MQEQADISKHLKYFSSLFVKESLRCMISVHTNCSTFTKPRAHTGTWLPVLM